ncbi:histidine kinase [Actinoplanes sp. NPDC049802]|uniref:sensor histidine kinase n=1 Tax=Actinoplanes sp. NPDC049802 TaxID=3154742 RepID=UPI0033C39BC3
MRLLPRLRRRPWLTDLLAGGFVAAVAAMGALTGAGEAHDIPLVPDLATAAVAGLVVALARVAPVPVLVLSAAVEVGYLIAGWTIPPLIFAVGWALYQLALRHDRRISWAASLGCAVLFWTVAAVADPAAGWWTPLALTSFTLTGMATAAGEAVRSRRAYVAEVEDRARRVEQSRELEVRRRVAEERLRIARELHDVVAHHIAVINVQSGAAAYALSRRPEAAGPPLEHIRRASSTVLRELTSIVGLLRQPGDASPSPHPQPGLSALPELLDAFAASGVRVEVSSSGARRSLPASTDLAAYRIVQEALTNARKHGCTGSPVRIGFEWGRDHLTIEVGNAVAHEEDQGGAGFGLIGMRERAAAAGGTIQAGRTTGDRFTVRATLPAGLGEEL